MVNCSETILSALLAAGDKLSPAAGDAVRRFTAARLRPDGGFMGRSDRGDSYYSHFGYAIALAMGVDMPIEIQYKFLDSCRLSGNLDFVHAISIVRCYMTLATIEEIRRRGGGAGLALAGGLLANLRRRAIMKKIARQVRDLLELIRQHRSADGGFNHEQAGAEYGTTYAAFLAWSLFDDLGIAIENANALMRSVESLKCPDGSFANQRGSVTGVVTATAAALVMLNGGSGAHADSTEWLKSCRGPHGGFLPAAGGVMLADLLSTSIALLALKLTGSNLADCAGGTERFVDIHWDETGGFFGSAADQQPDCEYTYYALLALGLA